MWPNPRLRSTGRNISRDQSSTATRSRALAGVHRVYHLAANTNLWSRRRREFEDVNVRGTEIVLEQAARVNVERIVHCSTESILKSHSHRLVAPLADAEPGLTIESVPGPYCRSKFVAEQRALEAAQRGLPVIVVNPTLPVGPGDRFLTPPTRMLVLFLNGGTPAYLDYDFNMIDVRNAALGHILAAERGRIGERYIRTCVWRSFWTPWRSFPAFRCRKPVFPIGSPSPSPASRSSWPTGSRTDIRRLR